MVNLIGEKKEKKIYEVIMTNPSIDPAFCYVLSAFIRVLTTTVFWVIFFCKTEKYKYLSSINGQ